MKKLNPILIITGILLCFNAKAQDVNYTQYFSAPLKLNPAIMGANRNIDFTLNHRNQWGTAGGLTDGSFVSSRFTFMMPVVPSENSKLDIGVSAISDEAGPFNTLDASIAVNYDIKLTKTDHHLSMALYGGYIQKKLNTDDLTFDKQYQNGSFDKNNPTGETFENAQTSYPDLGFGLMWYYNPSADSGSGGTMNAFAGVSGYHVHSPDESFAGEQGVLPAKYIGMSGVKFITKGKLDFTPNIRVVQQAGAVDIASGLYADYRLDGNDQKITLGAWYKQNNTVAGILGFTFSGFTLGYSYDMATTPLSVALPNAGSHEITLSYKIGHTDSYNPTPFSMF